MPLVFSGYGLGISVDRDLPGLRGLPAASRVDVEVRVDGLPSWLAKTPATQAWYVSPHCDERGRPGLRVWRLGQGDYFRLLYVDGAEFLVDRSGSRVWAACPETSAPGDAASYLLGPIMGFVLRLRGVACLHASAVAVGGLAIAFLGPSGAGKSTTAAAFAGRGCPVLSDDIVPLTGGDGSFLAQPGYPRLRLWPASVDALRQAAGFPHQAAPTSRERRHHLDLIGSGYLFQREPLPLAAVYLLNERCVDRGVPRVGAVPAVTGLLAMLANTSRRTSRR